MSQSATTEDGPTDDAKAYRTIRPTEPTTSPNPEEGLRLVRAFLRIKSPTLREAVIHFVDDLEPDLKLKRLLNQCVIQTARPLTLVCRTVEIAGNPGERGSRRRFEVDQPRTLTY